MELIECDLLIFYRAKMDDKDQKASEAGLKIAVSWLV